MRILAVGDIHCKIWIINKIEKIIDNYDAIVFMGDFSDNWNNSSDSMLTWAKVKQLSDNNKDKVYSVISNHDFSYIHKEVAGRSSGYNQITQLVINTLDNKHIKDWLLSLPVVLYLDDITFSHAGVSESWNGELDIDSLWCSDSPIWARPDTVDYKKINQVFGHTPQKTCTEIDKNIWCIDTFSTHRRSGDNIGDCSVLEIIDGKKFKVIQL